MLFELFTHAMILEILRFLDDDDYEDYKALLAREPVSFWRENVIVVVGYVNGLCHQGA